MKQLFTITALLFSTLSFAQNVGIGETTPTAMRLQVKAPDSAVALIHNATTSGTNVKTSLFFKTGNSYSGSVATIGTSATHRMGLFTFGGLLTSGLQERVSILDGGKVGINNIVPDARLHVNALDSNIITLQNNQTLGIGTKSNLYFKTGVATGSNYYTGAISTIGASNNSARMGFSTFSSNDPTDLKERLTILDNGNVGVGTITPTTDLDVSGTFRATGTGQFLGLLNATNGLSVFGSATVNGNITASGAATVNNLTVTGPAQVGGALSTSNNLTVAGTARISGGSPGLNKVLSSVDAQGNAVWANSSIESAFCAYAYRIFCPQIFSLIPFATNGPETFDQAGNFNNSLSRFIAPSLGVYHFDLNLSFVTGFGNIYANYYPDNQGYAEIEVRKNGIASDIYQASQIIILGQNNYVLQIANGDLHLSFTIKMNTNDYLEFFFRQNFVIHPAATIESKNVKITSFLQGYRVN